MALTEVTEVTPLLQVDPSKVENAIQFYLATFGATLISKFISPEASFGALKIGPLTFIVTDDR